MVDAPAGAAEGECLMKAVMISIHPKWVHKILDGKKTVEVRKTVPKIATPFKCYIYMTSGGWEWRDPFSTAVIPPSGTKEMYCGAQRVVGEFICDRISPIAYTMDGLADVVDVKTSCLSPKDFIEYGRGKPLYGWHISDLKVYDKPKKLNEFQNPCVEYEKNSPQCGYCNYYHSMGEYPAECGCDGAKPMIRPPQSWCYVEES